MTAKHKLLQPDLYTMKIIVDMYSIFVEGLVPELDQEDIAILGCYQAQYRYYSSGLAKMAKEISGLTDRVLTDKIDRRQGSEFDIIISDLTRTQDAGFLKDRRRLNVLFSRAKHGLYVVGNKRFIDRLDESKGRFLGQFQSEYLKFCRRRTSCTECRWYQPGQVDVSNEANVESLFLLS
jgi:hypothetical protein